MLTKCQGNCVENWRWKKCLGNCLENWSWKKWLGNCVQNCGESDRKSAVSRIQCYKPQVEKTTTVQASVSAWQTVWEIDVGNAGFSWAGQWILFYIVHYPFQQNHHMLTEHCSVAFCLIVAVCALWRILAKCSNICALRHVGKKCIPNHEGVFVENLCV